MQPRAYYNEIDPFAAHWLYNLIQRNLIAPGDIDTRDIRDVRPIDLKPYTQCHFFAGIGAWSHALRRAGWRDDRQVWTGSCPCQPFSAAGKGGGFADERHLWPHLHYLIAQCRPDIVLGEQVASKDGLRWLDLVQSDMEGTDYAFGAVDSCSAGFGAPHIRQRLYWMAYAAQQQHDGAWRGGARGRIEPSDGGATGGLAISNDADGRDAQVGHIQRGGFDRFQSSDDVSLRQGNIGIGHNSNSELGRPGPVNGLWRNADWIFCRDGRWRPVEPGSSPLAHGLPRGMGAGGAELRRLAGVASLDGESLDRAKAYRIGALRAYGNAINAEQATAFCEVAKEFLQ